MLAPTAAAAAADAARRTAVEAGPMLRCIVRCVGLLRGVARDRTGLPVRDGRGGKGATAVPALLPALHVPAGLPTAEEELQRLLIDAKVGDHMRAAAALAAVPFRSPPYDGALRATALQRKPPLTERPPGALGTSVPTGRGACFRRRWALPSPRAIGWST